MIEFILWLITFGLIKPGEDLGWWKFDPFGGALRPVKKKKRKK